VGRIFSDRCWVGAKGQVLRWGGSGFEVGRDPSPVVADSEVAQIGYTSRVNARAKRLLDEVLELPAEERDAFAAELLQTLDGPPDVRTDDALADEIQRRAEEALKSDWKGHTWEEVRSEVERSLRESRRE
jgi:putative addiction module component (TIGR02574 family)